jgi:hypothetical protein
MANNVGQQLSVLTKQVENLTVIATNSSASMTGIMDRLGTSLIREMLYVYFLTLTTIDYYIIHSFQRLDNEFVRRGQPPLHESQSLKMVKSRRRLMLNVVKKHRQLNNPHPLLPWIIISGRT